MKQVDGAHARQVLDHLARVCADMAIATEDGGLAQVPGALPPGSWIHRAAVPQEATGSRWRAREAAYRAMAARCASEDGRQGWLVIAARCAELAAYLEVMSASRDAGSRRYPALPGASRPAPLGRDLPRRGSRRGGDP